MRAEDRIKDQFNWMRKQWEAVQPWGSNFRPIPLPPSTLTPQERARWQPVTKPTLYCSDIQTLLIDDQGGTIGCCTSCHEDWDYDDGFYAEGWDNLKDGREIHVCCDIKNKLRDQGLLK